MNVQVSRVRASAQRVRRSERRLLDDPGEHTIVMLQCAGQARVAQDGARLTMLPGTVAALDSRRPYGIDFDRPFEQVVLKVPTGALRERLGGRAPRLARPPDAQALLGARLLAPLVDAMLAPEPPADGERLARLIVDLLAMTLAPDAAGTLQRVERSVADTRIERARAHVLERLHDPDLSVASVAAHQGVSARLLQRLFAERGLTLSRMILEARLDACHAALRDPAQRSRSVLAIAVAHGFSDPSHFARAFRERFGTTPSAARS